MGYLIYAIATEMWLCFFYRNKRTKKLNVSGYHFATNLFAMLSNVKEC